MEDIEMFSQNEISSVFATKLPQKLPMTLMLAYLCYFEDMRSLLMLLSRRS